MAVTERSYAYFSHEADVGLIGRGPTLESAFEAAAEALFGVMVDLHAIRPVASVQVEFDETDPELALVTWLNHLLAEARVAGLVLGRFELRRSNGHWVGQAWGERWRADLERGVEVKGATLTMLSVVQTDGGWEARCVVDV
jgi:SHS2 domain-containing protein